MPRGVSLYDEARLQGRLWTPSLLSTAALYEWDVTQPGAYSPGSLTTIDGRLTAGQGTVSAQPTYNPTGLNGRPTLVFSGAQRLDVPAFAQTQTWTAFAVVAPTALSGTQSIIDADGNTGSRIGQYLRFSAASAQAIAFNTGVSAFTAGTASAGVGQVHVLAAVRSATSISVSVNGGVANTTATSGTPQSGSKGLSLGGYYLTTGAFFSGRASYFAYAPAALTQAEIDKVIGALTWKFGAQGGLYAAQRFVNRPPLIGD